ncbi:MAG: hypothetical protein RIT27_728 [Pseudomonadota bacterium]
MLLNFLLAVISLLPILLISELQNPPSPEVFQKGLQILMPFLPLYMIGMVFCNAAIFYRLGCLMQNNLLSLTQVYAFILRKLLPLCGATILFVLAVGIGFMALFVPSVIFATYLMLYQPLILFANTNMFESLENSFRLVKGKGWYAAIIGGVAMLFIPFCSLFLEMVFNTLSIDISFELTLIIEILLNTFLASFFHCTLLVLYQTLSNYRPLSVSDHFVA